MKIKMSNALAMALTVVLVFTTSLQFWSADADDQSSICNMTQAGITACKPFIRTKIPMDTPDPSCCSALKAANLTCLCSYKGSDYSKMLYFYGINLERAFKLPALCDVTAPQNCS